MKTKEWICDECGKEFTYPHEGSVESGFGLCNQCRETMERVRG
jgi:formylmethanofuran dehydrogenase subunit E